MVKPIHMALASAAVMSLLAPGTMVFAASTHSNAPSLPVVSALPTNNAGNVKPNSPVTLTLNVNSPAFRPYRQAFELPTSAHPQVGVLVTGPGGSALYTLGHGLTFDAQTGVLTVTHHTSWHRYSTYTATLLVKAALNQYLSQQQSHGQSRASHAPANDTYQVAFETGSAIGEPVNWQAHLASTKPSVITGDVLVVQATDSYGDPATSGSYSVSATGQPALSSSFSAPTASIMDGSGQSLVTDHQAQVVTMTIATQGPYAGHDDHAITLVPAVFQPGPPAAMTMIGPGAMQAGQQSAETGLVTDKYGNPVNPSVLEFSASDGAITSPVTTNGGQYDTTFTGPQKLSGTPGQGEFVTLVGQSLQGSAQAQTTLIIDPGPLAHLTLNSVQLIRPGQTMTVTGQATDQYGNAVLNGTDINLAATGGAIASTKTQGGGFSATYTAPSTPGTYTITASANGQQQSDTVTVVNPIPSGAVVTLGQPKVGSNGQITVTGALNAPSGTPVSGAMLSLLVTGGSVANSQVITNDAGNFVASVMPTSGQTPVTITASGTTASGGSIQSSSAIDPLVYGNQSWTDTGIPVTAGQKVTISDTGSWASDLYARVGTSGVPVKVGADGSFVTAVSGTLYLGTNGTTQSGNVDALVSVGGVSGVVPTMDLATGTKTVTANGTTTVSGQVMMGTIPVVDAPVTLSTTSGTFNDPSAKVIVYTNGEGHYSATFNAPASGSPIISADYTPSTGSAIQQTAKLTVGNPIVLQAGSQSLIANSGSSTVITGTLTNDGSPLANTPVSLSASNGSLSASTTTTNSEGQFSVTYTAGASAGTAVITATAGGVAQSIDVTLTSGSSTDPSVTGTMQLPFFSTGTTLAPGWTLSGSAANYSNYTAGSYGGSVAAGGWSNISGSGSASYQFTVPSGQTATLTYGIPAGGFQNNDPANISVNGQLVASVNRDIATVGSTTSSAQVLWSQTFSPGTYTITIASGASGVGINVYGLWTSNTNISAPSSTTNTPVSIASVMDDDFVSPYTYGTPTDAIHPTNPGVVWFFGNAVPAGQYLNVAVPTQNAGGFYFQVDGGPGIYGIGAIPQSDYSGGDYHFSVPVQSWAEQDINIWNYSDVQSFSAAPTLTYSAKPVYPVISGMW